MEALVPYEIVTWNSNGALRKKFGKHSKLEANILIIQECENPSESTEIYQNWVGNETIVKMTISKLPQFTPKAAELWATISAAIKPQLLANVF